MSSLRVIPRSTLLSERYDERTNGSTTTPLSRRGFGKV
jgi:hypothetical protein